MDWSRVYPYGVQAVLVSAPLIFAALFWITAPYGRHSNGRSRAWGPSLNPKVAWVLMESPSVFWFAYVFWSGPYRNAAASLVLFALWQLHYCQRTFVYPALLKPNATPMPLNVALLGFFYNCINASLNAAAIAHIRAYDASWFVDPRFAIGVAVFFLGMGINLHSDHILRNLRKPGETGYKIPHGGMYKYLSAPNYFGEILEWCGWAIATWSGAGLSFAVFTVANLAPRAIKHHQWYQQKFPNYPRNRKALIPGLL